MKRNSKRKSLIGLLLALIVVGLFVFFGYSTMNQIKLGLDLAGGVSITYQAKEANPTKEQMSDTVYKLLKRVQNYSTEAEVYQEGSNRINVDIPGVSDANAILEELGKPGSLMFLDSDGKPVLDGKDVKTAKGGMTEANGQKQYVVALTFDDAGTKAFADATTKGVGKPIYIVYDGQVISSPQVKEPITGGSCQIDGMKDYDEANNLASTIRIGSLSLQLEELRSNVVGAKLGQEAISTSLKAGVIGFGVIVLFMILAYLVPGLAASLALTMYVGLMLLLLVAFNITLTLPGVAGIILSIGMAVDANVIIFTRIKEEIGAGRTVKASIKTGFEKALSAIVDGNVTTLIAAAVLYVKGSGTVKGFASTLALGIILSMFTALFVTKFILNCLYESGFQAPKYYGVKKDERVIPFLKHRRIFFALSIAVTIIGFGAMGLNKVQSGSIMNYSMEFKGGTSTNVTFNQDLSLDDISSKVVPVVEKITGEAGTQTQKVAGSNEVIIKTRTLNMEEREALDQALAAKFGVDQGKITAESISGAVSTEMKQDAVIAMAIAIVFMLLYIWFRFKNITFAVSSILALAHDVMIVVACYAVFKWSVGSTFIACILTIIGYSINSTIVIFDRVRENMKSKKADQTEEDVANISITQTLTRSINTTLTTFIMVFVLYLMGVSSIREFALPLMVGIVCGAYSSVFLSGAMWYVFGEKRKKNALKKKEKQREQIKAKNSKSKKSKVKDGKES